MTSETSSQPAYTQTPRYLATTNTLLTLHKTDPTLVPTSPADPTPIPYALSYHLRLIHHTINLSAPSCPSEPLLLASHAQHLLRFKFPRSAYPQGLAGYKSWRTAASKFHASQMEKIMSENGYDGEMVQRVKDLITKKNLHKKTDEECQVLEDAACLVFLEKEFEEFLAKWEEDKVVNVLKKTWGKMGEKGRLAALELVGTLPDELANVVKKALADEKEKEEKVEGEI